MEPPVLVERDHQSVTIGWVKNSSVFEISDVTKYELQYAALKEGDDLHWVSLSKALTGNIIRKKNLEANTSYKFRIRCYLGEDMDAEADFSSSSDSFFVLGSDMLLMSPPEKVSSETNSITVKWGEVGGAEGYKLRYKKSTDISWTRIDTIISGMTIKKKGLDMACAYCFSVIPVGLSEEFNYSYSMASLPIPTASFSKAMASIFPSTLLTKSPALMSKPTPEIMGGKVCAIYFSASWCGPCRNFTPQLLGLYNQAKSASKNFEVIFCSLDHNEEDFTAYYAKMGWPAIPYDSNQREGLAARYKVNGIPRLLVLGSGGQILCDNAVGSASLAAIDGWQAMNAR
jgi:thiol-disulfide isomerase/thioredoxin